MCEMFESNTTLTFANSHKMEHFTFQNSSPCFTAPWECTQNIAKHKQRLLAQIFESPSDPQLTAATEGLIRMGDGVPIDQLLYCAIHVTHPLLEGPESRSQAPPDEFIIAFTSVREAQLDLNYRNLDWRSFRICELLVSGKALGIAHWYLPAGTLAQRARSAVLVPVTSIQSVSDPIPWAPYPGTQDMLCAIDRMEMATQELGRVMAENAKTIARFTNGR